MGIPLVTILSKLLALSIFNIPIVARVNSSLAILVGGIALTVTVTFLRNNLFKNNLLRFASGMSAGLMAAKFTKWLPNLPIDADVQVNLLSMEMDISKGGEVDEKAGYQRPVKNLLSLSFTTSLHADTIAMRQTAWHGGWLLAE